MVKAKMTPIQTYFAICKGYCAINILILPKQFDNGGWIVAILSVNIACSFVLLCANKMVACALKTGKYNFSEIVNTALGHRGKAFADVVLATCQFSFTIAQISFTLEALESIFGGEKGHKIDMWWFALLIICVYTPLAWVRRVQVFAVGYIIGISAILFTTVVVAGYCIIGLAKDGPVNDGVKPINTVKMWDMIGFSFYAFEGIGTIMPIMKESENPE